jgi:hypothetical protein
VEVSLRVEPGRVGWTDRAGWIFPRKTKLNDSVGREMMAKQMLAPDEE